MKKRLPLLACGALAACATAPVEPVSTPSAPILSTRAETAAPRVPGGMQWLYGSGEGAVASLQIYRDLTSYVRARAAVRPKDSVILADGAAPAAPRFIPCGDRPLAVVLDVDETAVQNLGYEYDEARRSRSYDAELWNRWEQTGQRAVSPMPGAVESLQAIRRAGVQVIFNSNRLAANAAASEAAIAFAGLGPAKHGETLFLQGDFAPGSAKDPRRAAIAQRYCVIAMAGDQLGDFSDHFNSRALSVTERRRLATSPALNGLWGNGWFLFSNPVYGPSIRGELDEVFPADRRWSDSEGD